MLPRLLFFGICLCSPLVVCAQSWSSNNENLKITVDGGWASESSSGYIPVQFDITNSGDNRVIEIVGEGQRFGGAEGPGRVSVRQQVTLRRGDHRHLTIPVPVGPYNGSIQFEIHEGGRTLETFDHVGFRGESSNQSVLIVSARGSENDLVRYGWLRSGPKYMGVTTRPDVDFIRDPSRLPENWLGYTSLRAVLIAPSEWSQLTEPQQNALLTWTAAGGDLIVLDAEPATIFSKAQMHSDPDETGAVHYFFGRVYPAQSAAITEGGLAKTLEAARRVPEELSLVLPVDRSPSWGHILEHGFHLPIPGIDGVPATAYLWILLIFSLLIGPANYIVLWRKRRQPLMVITVPLISGAFVAVLAGYAIAGEGFGVRARAATFTILDQAGNHAATRASISLYAAGMTPGGGLNFPRDTAVFSMGTNGRGIREEALDLTTAQRFTSGMIRARLPANFQEISFRPARERLTVSRDSNGIEVFNGLGVAVRRLYYRDKGTLYALANPLPEGTKARLRPENSNVIPASFKELLKLAGPSAERFQYALEHVSDNSYAAVLERSPFWDAGIPDFAERSSFHFLIGILERQP
jgi:hypothetical protein